MERKLGLAKIKDKKKSNSKIKWLKGKYNWRPKPDAKPLLEVYWAKTLIILPLES